MVRVNVDPVDIGQPVVLPHPWPQLEARGFHRDLADRARGFALVCRRLGLEELGNETLTLIGKGFAEPFDANRFEPTVDDPDREFKLKHLAALKGLAAEFGDRVSAVIWDTFAFLGTRPNPHESATIISAKEYLPIPWWFADSVLHAAGKVYGLKLHMDSRMFAATGMVLEHNCDCSCSAKPASDGGQVACLITRDRFQEATAALMSHLCSESLLIGGLAMPFNMGFSPEAMEAIAA